MPETIDRLLDAAEDGVRLRGYHAVSFRDLADDLGIKSASVHYHFRQKEDLGVALVERYRDRFFADLEARTAGAKSGAEKLHAFCQAYRAALVGSDRICLCGMLGAETCGLPAPLSDAVSGFFRANMDWIDDALSGDLPPPERKALAAALLSTLQGAMMLAVSLDDHGVFDDAVKAFFQGMGG